MAQPPLPMTIRSRRSLAVWRTLALVSSAPPWQLMHRPVPVNRSMPCFSRAERAAASPSRKRSTCESSATRHLAFRERRSHGLRCQTTRLDGNPLALEISVRIDLPHEGRRIEVAERADTVEDVIRTPVPEVVEVEYRIDHARRVARLDSSGVDLMDLKHRIGIAIADIGSLARCDADK